jgi:signal transduction histidine kinase/DNA-binding response OmpR family regulator
MLIHFVRYFLKTFQQFPRWDKYLLIFSFVQVFVLLFSSFASAVFQINLATLSHVSENVVKLIYGISLLATLLLYLRDKDRITRLVIVGLTPILLLGVVVYASFVVLGLYSPRLGAPDISGYTSEFNSAAFFILIVTFFWMMAFFTWVLFLRFSNVRKALEQQSSLDHLKSRFFANISHEFRTPLTLIIGPIEDLMQDKNAQKFKEPLQYIHRNSKRLLQLINQLLDLSRLDVGNYEVNTSREDIIPFVKQIVHSFSSMAHRKNILLETEIDPRLKNELRNELTRFYFDEDIFEKILYNLLSNAFKFTPEDGNIIVSICLSENNLLELRVEDTGMGIPSEKLPFIFDRFYQADDSYKRQYEGTGIGLSLVKELVELHKGTITVKSSLNNQTTFSCYFPFNKKILSKKAAAKIVTKQNTGSFAAKEFPKETIGEENENSESENTIDIAKPTVLVVDDQLDVRKYICDKLAETYTVIEAKNGKEGFESAKQHIPDLVISDVMMPKMDGFELCKLLKTDDFTSHVPVILLTARAEDVDKLTGLETGADAYLIKPFNSKELLLRVHNLIELRNKLRKKFSGKLLVKPSEITVTSQDSQFMQRLLETVEKHIDDEKFSVEELGREVGMSPSQINRKLKAIINQSASAFIRSVRMERAMELLKNDQATIAEVAYETGFSEPAYFSRVFKNHFGYSPSEVKK